MLQNRVSWCRMDSDASGYGPVACSCEDDNEPLGSIKDWQFLDKLENNPLLKKEQAQWDWLDRNRKWFCCTNLYHRANNSIHLVP